jgi:hypothetical protein
MTTARQKEREQAIAEYYLSIIELPGELIKSERPDFIVQTNDRKVGIEITEYHQPAHSGRKFPRKVVEATWEKLLEAVARYRESNKGLANLNVKLSFKTLHVPATGQHDEFVRAVHQEILKAAVDEKNSKVEIRIANHHSPILLTYLKSIGVRRAKGYGYWSWNQEFAGIGTTENELLSLIEKKLEAKYDGFEEVHLVVAGDGPTASSYIGYLHPDILNGWQNLNVRIRESPFSRVTLLSNDHSCIWQQDQGWTSFD